jgi:radical SAM superfamily enzyme YgiQ (UPF0313 family)
MAEIVLTTLNAKFIHTAFGLRYLFANLGDLQTRAALVEFDINQRPIEIAEALLQLQPRLIGFGVYIWNVTPTREILAILKRVRPDLTIVLGGPEVSYETEAQELVRLADFVITGEADLEFAEVCRTLLARKRSADKVIAAKPPELAHLAFPYDLYTDADLAHRVIYVEASRGCPFSCEFCLSSLDPAVRHFPLTAFLDQMRRLLDRGARQFKFVDRTFNLNPTASRIILEFFLQHLRPGLFLHFEMVPDRLPESLREIIVRFPPGTLQFEIGIQTFNPEVARLISRRQDYGQVAENFRFLREKTGVHIHADLIVGLPGESTESFAAGFDRLVTLGPQEIQVGILKRLRGVPISRHTAEWQMVYGDDPPYEILQNRLIDFATMQRLRRFARYWDLVGNSGRFVETTPLLWCQSGSPFAGFLRWSDWLHKRLGRQHGIALDHLAECLFLFLTREATLEATLVAEGMWRDYQRTGRRDVPLFLRPHLSGEVPSRKPAPTAAGLRRQARHRSRKGGVRAGVAAKR